MFRLIPTYFLCVNFFFFMEIQSKRRKLKAKEDRISDLPDEIIQHILSFLPSTKAIQTSILSKRWNKQWIHVTALSFDSFTATSPGNFHKLVKNTMINHHDCSKIKKFYVEYPYLNISPSDSKFDEVIFLATRKHVEELTLSSYSKVPECLFKNASSVVRLTLSSCYIMPMREVNWGRLTELHLKGCRLNGQALEHILSGSPLLESLELNYCSMIDNLVIASKSLKRLVLQHSSDAAPILSMEISCPNLVGLYLTRANLHPNSFAQVIENVLSISLSLKSLELNRIRCTVDLDCLVITSKSLKRLVLNLDGCFGILNIQVSCPQLQMLKLIGILRVRTVELLNLPSSLCATFDFRHSQRDEICNSLVKHILHQLQHVKELTIGSLFIRCLSALEAGDMFPFVLNIKRLILNSPDLIYDGFGVELILRNALTLEKLVINMPHHHQDEFINCEENFWSSNATNFNYLLSHVKSIEIIGFPMTYDKCSFMTNFIEFLLKNAPVLEKMVLILTDLPDIVPSGIYHSLLHLPRCSKHAIIELVNCK